MRLILAALTLAPVAGFAATRYIRISRGEVQAHDRIAFTRSRGDGFLYEGTGLAGQVLQKFDVPQPFFGEGITVLPPPTLLEVR